MVLPPISAALSQITCFNSSPGRFIVLVINLIPVPYTDCILSKTSSTFRHDMFLQHHKHLESLRNNSVFFKFFSFRLSKDHHKANFALPDVQRAQCFSASAIFIFICPLLASAVSKMVHLIFFIDCITQCCPYFRKRYAQYFLNFFLVSSGCAVSFHLHLHISSLLYSKGPKHLWYSCLDPFFFSARPAAI